ncbi:MAG: ABC transporter ATP-binding protein/permease [Beijerinckiaceae bacterium]|nr:ABC transporter ATP-binding protein/permease [Beijerinckiaceae bacterium]
MYRFFETLVDGLKQPPADSPPPSLLRFYWYFARQVKWVLLAFVLVSVVVALLETTVPFFIGQLVGILSKTPRETLLETAGPTLATMVFVVLIARPGAILLQRLITNQSLVSNMNTMIRWQSHWHVVRQSVGFFQSDFAGRIANRVMQAGHALRETVIALIRSVLHILVYGLGAVGLLLAQDWRLAVPMVVWFALYVTLLIWMIPRQRDAARAASEKRSAVTGRVVDSYTNILTVKLFAKVRDEDRHVRESMAELNGSFLAQQRLSTTFIALLNFLNAMLLVTTGALAVILWQNAMVEIGTLAMVLPLTSQIIAMSGWVAYEVQGIFENIGLVQESMLSIAQPLQMQDEAGTPELQVDRGRIDFESVSFSYGRKDRSDNRGGVAQGPVIDRFSLAIQPGEKVGLVGRSGAGKTTLTSLLLRFHDVEGGRISIDGEDIRGVTQESLRDAISVVTQDTSLLHRSIRENIIYGRRSASEEEMIAAAREAAAHDFIMQLEDSFGRRGYDAHVGERGVKLSGGQRQRIAIARVILKNAPILVLDEATSALDSEIEAAIQDSLSSLMDGKTVIAIAHRLSTLQIMDRLVVLDRGRIVEEGSHASLLKKGGLYADLWRRQSGGFLPDQRAVAAE